MGRGHQLYGCQLRGRGYAEFLQDVTPTFISPSVISLNISTSYDCGGAHPDFGDSPLNIDVKTGHPLSLEDVLWVGEGQPILHADRYRGGDQPLTEAEDAARSKYQREIFKPWLIKQLTALYPDEMKEHRRRAMKTVATSPMKTTGAIQTGTSPKRSELGDVLRPRRTRLRFTRLVDLPSR